MIRGPAVTPTGIPIATPNVPLNREHLEGQNLNAGTTTTKNIEPTVAGSKRYTTPVFIENDDVECADPWYSLKLIMCNFAMFTESRYPEWSGKLKHNVVRFFL